MRISKFVAAFVTAGLLDCGGGGGGGTDAGDQGLDTFWRRVPRDTYTQKQFLRCAGSGPIVFHLDGQPRPESDCPRGTNCIGSA